MKNVSDEIEYIIIQNLQSSINGKIRKVKHTVTIKLWNIRRVDVVRHHIYMAYYQ